jgi:hypothetical protein
MNFRNARLPGHGSVAPRLPGRPTTKDTLIKLDDEVDDLAALQLREAELILASTSDDGIVKKNKNNPHKMQGKYNCKYSKTIFNLRTIRRFT